MRGKLCLSCGQAYDAYESLSAVRVVQRSRIDPLGDITVLQSDGSKARFVQPEVSRRER